MLKICVWLLDYKHLLTNEFLVSKETVKLTNEHSIPTERAENKYLLNYVSQIFWYSLVSDSEIACILKMKVKSDHHSKFSSLSNWKEEAWKISELQRLDQLSYEATHWELG